MSAEIVNGYIRRHGLGFNQTYKELMRKTWSRPLEGDADA